MIRALLAFLILFSFSTSASADFVLTPLVASLLVAAGTGLTGATLTAVASAISAIIVAGAAFAVNSLLAPSQKLDPSKGRETFKASESSEIRAIGRVRLGGMIAFGATNVHNKFRLILHAKSFDAVESHYLGGKEVIIDSDGAVTSKPYTISGTTYIWIKNDLGDPDKVAWPDLMTYFPALWTSNHRVRGVAQSLVRYLSPGVTSARFLRLYQSGPPEYNVIARGERVYDPREGSHDVSDPDTWEWSDNGILLALHMMLTFPRFDSSYFDMALIEAEADKADVLVDTIDGTEPRARAWGIWPSEGSRLDMLKQLLDSIGAELVITDANLIGIQLIDDDRTAAATLEITTKHIQKFDWRSGPESVERPNRVRLSYYSPERNYELAEIDLSQAAWSYVQDEIDLVGEQSMEISLPFCPSASQAQRIARRMFLMSRADQASMVTDMAGVAAWGQRVIQVTIDDLEETLLCAIASPRVGDKSGLVEIPFITVPSMPTWDPTIHEAPAPLRIPEVTYSDSIDTPPTTTGYSVVTMPSTGIETRFMDVNVALGRGFSGGSATLERVYRVLDPLPGEWRPVTGFGGTTGYAQIDLSGLTIQFRQREYNTDDENSDWSEIFEGVVPAVDNSVPGLPLQELNVTTGDIEFRPPVADRMDVVLLRITPPSLVTADYPIRPGDVVSFSYIPGSYTVYAVTSNGTLSAALVYVAP